MIALASDYLVFQLANGESVPFSADKICVELIGETPELFDYEFVRHAAHAVFHYFKHDLGRQIVTVGEFAGAMENALRKLAQSAKAAVELQSTAAVRESDLCRLAHESGEGCELLFFGRLREELHLQLEESPRVVRFHGLRSCVKQLVGSRRWTLRCRNLEEEIVAYLRECLSAETKQREFALVVH